MGILDRIAGTLDELTGDGRAAVADEIARARAVAADGDLARAEALLRSGRAWLFDELGQMWDDTTAGREITMQRRALVRLAAVNAGQNAIEATNLAYQLGGGASLFQGNRLERCFRDIHVAGQHVVMSPQVYMEPIGRVLFGLPPGTARF